MNKMINDIAKAMAWTAIDVDLEILKDHNAFHLFNFRFIHKDCKFCQAKVKRVLVKDGPYSKWENKRIK